MSKARNDVHEWKLSKKLLLASLLAVWGTVGNGEVIAGEQAKFNIQPTTSGTYAVSITGNENAASAMTNTVTAAYAIGGMTGAPVVNISSSGGNKFTLGKADNYNSGTNTRTLFLYGGSSGADRTSKISVGSLIFDAGGNAFGGTSSQHVYGSSQVWGFDSLAITNSDFVNGYTLAGVSGGASVGGGVYIGGGNSVTMNSVVFSNNKSEATTAVGTASGGGFRIDGIGAVNLTNMSVKNNSVSVSSTTANTGEASGGGAVFFNNQTSSVLSMSGGEFSGNTATGTFATGGAGGSARGGGMLIYTDGGSYQTVNLTGVAIKNNAAKSTVNGKAFGGGAALLGKLGTVTIGDSSGSATVISGNSAIAASDDATGGGLYISNANASVNDSVALTLKNTTVSDNLAEATGSAGLVMGGGLAINVVPTGGKDITTSISPDVTFARNTAKTNTGNSAAGGAIWTNTGLGTVGAAFDANKVIGNGWSVGGAVALMNGASELSLASEFTGNITSNTVNSTGGNALGGAIFFNDEKGKGSNLKISGTTISGNSSASTTGNAEGGSVWASTDGTITIANTGSGGLFTNNSVSGNGFSGGGAVFVAEASTSTNLISNYDFTGNRATSQTGTARGGAVYLGGNSTSSTITDATFTNNSVSGDAASRGGAVYANSDLTIVSTIAGGGVTFSGNSVSAGGVTTANGLYVEKTLYLTGDGVTTVEDGIDAGTAVNIAAASTLRMNLIANDSTITAPITGAGKLVKDGSYDLSLDGDGTFTGGTTINAGAVILNHVNAAGRGAISIAKDAELRLEYNTVSPGTKFNNEFSGAGDFVVDNHTVLDRDRTNFTGAYKVEAGKTLTFDYDDANFDNALKGTGTVEIAKDMVRPGQTAFDGKISVLDSGSLGLTLNTGAPALTVGAIDFNSSGELKVVGGTVLPSPSIYSGADSEGYDLIVSGTTVALPDYDLDATIAGNPDYLTPELRVDSTGKKIQAFAQLSWFAADPAKQHGTFTIEPGKTFEVAVPLTDQTAVAGWNGKDLTKLGGGTLIMSAQNTATGVFDQKAGGVRFKDGASWAGDYVQAAGSSFAANGNAGIGGDASFAGTVTLDNRSSLNAGGDFAMAQTGTLNLTPTSNITADTITFAPDTSVNVDFSGVPIDGQTRDYANILVARNGGLDTDLLSSLFSYSSILTSQSAYFDGDTMGLRYNFSTLQDKVNELPGMRDNIGVASAGLDDAFAKGALGDLQKYLYSIRGTDEFYAAMSSLASVEVAANMLAMGLAHHPERTTFNRFIGSAMQSVSQTGVSTDDAYGSLSSCGYGLREARNRIWAEGVLSWGSVSGDGRSSGYDTRRNGLRLGYDFLATDNLILGGMFSYTDPRLKAGSTKIEADDFTFALYGYSRLAEHFHATGFVGYGHERYDMTRRGPLGGHRAKYSGNSFYSALEFSAPFAIGCSGLTIAPVAGIDFVKSWTNGYAESGPQGAYRMNKWQDDVLTARVGIAARYDIGDRVTLRGEARYGRVLNGHPGSAVTGQFVGVPAGQTMSFNGSKIGRNNLNVDVGAEVYLDSAKRVSAYAAYTFDYANRFRNHGGRAGISFNW